MLRDILLALEWLQTNLPAFGGDPARVTIGGESAGAKLTDLLMGVPCAEGLFHQMISESGGAERIMSAARAAEVATAFTASWTQTSGQPPSALKSAPAPGIIDAQTEFMRAYPMHFPLRPEIDGKLVPRPPLDSIRDGSAAGKRLLLGTNRDESALFLGPHPVHDPGPQELGNLSGQQFRAIAAQYAQLYPDMSPDLRRIRSLTAEEYWVPSVRVADACVQGRGTAFVYRFDYSASQGRFAGLAYHSEELGYVWHHLNPQERSASDLAMAATIHAAWCSFIRDEAPRAPGLPPWPPYSSITRPTMILNTTSHVEDNPQGAELALWSGLLMQ